VALVYTMFWLNLGPSTRAMAASAVIIALGSLRHEASA